MSDRVPVYVFIVGNVPVESGELFIEPDGTITGSITENTYKILATSKKRWFFAILPQRENE